MTHSPMRLPLVAALLCASLQAWACTPTGDPQLASGGFRESFDKTKIGAHWLNTGGPYEVREGQLHVRGARNHPLWLRRRLPRDLRIEFKARSESSEGDLKFEVFGDGSSFARSESYTATSYVVIFGGWNNSTNLIARLDEHGSERQVGKTKRVVPGQSYRLRFERRKDVLRFFVDDELLVEMKDRRPLEGRGHDHFAFNNWESDVWFDDLSITAL